MLGVTTRTGTRSAAFIVRAYEVRGDCLIEIETCPHSDRRAVGELGAGTREPRAQRRVGAALRTPHAHSLRARENRA